MASNVRNLSFSVSVRRDVQKMRPRGHTVQPIAIGGAEYWLTCSDCGAECGPFSLDGMRWKLEAMVVMLGGVVTWPGAKADDDA